MYDRFIRSRILLTCSYEKTLLMVVSVFINESRSWTKNFCRDSYPCTSVMYSTTELISLCSSKEIADDAFTTLPSFASLLRSSNSMKCFSWLLRETLNAPQGPYEERKATRQRENGISFIFFVRERRKYAAIKT